MTYDICCEAFGEKSVISEISRDMRKFFPNFIYPEGAPSINSPVRKVRGFDRSCTRYIG